MQQRLKIALFGATGMIGSRIAAEALARGHEVAAISRRPQPVEGAAGLTTLAGDVFDAQANAQRIAGFDAIASAYGPAQEDTAKVIQATRALIELARISGVKRLVAVGGAGSLEVAPGKQLVDTEGFPDAYKAVALAHREALGLYREATDIDWTFFAPAAIIAPGTKTGAFRTGADTLIVDAGGASKISAEDYAIAFVDEIEQNRFVRRIATVAY
ncbi:NAD(P)-dependent oxidoreductase [Trinickia diaoshuihuensis]|jgi:putative NADH-flavin reductase|uniref:NAD(P)-dependent oxidoreductase n=1 Tax=Trinickia diaoshuihuensis TaxID=2292265 RepID=UPI000E2818B8|nr:NAD(P)H-binding protein [Trinickia diaoshuihuensis]